MFSAALAMFVCGCGMPYDSIVLACVEAGFSRESSEDAIEDLRDIKCEIIEPRFGFFQILD